MNERPSWCVLGAARSPFPFAFELELLFVEESSKGKGARELGTNTPASALKASPLPCFKTPSLIPGEKSSATRSKLEPSHPRIPMRSSCSSSGVLVEERRSRRERKDGSLAIWLRVCGFLRKSGQIRSIHHPLRNSFAERTRRVLTFAISQ